MAAKNHPKAGQYFRLTSNGLWTSQDINPLWAEDSSEYFRANKYPEPVQTERYSGGLNIRVEVDEETKRRHIERVKKLIIHDHTYFRRDLFSKRKSKGINDLVMRAIASVEDEPKPNKGQVSESTKNTQLYKYLTTPIDDRRRTGEAFGHSMVRDIIKARPPHVTMRVASRTVRTQPPQQQQQPLLQQQPPESSQQQQQQTLLQQQPPGSSQHQQQQKVHQQQPALENVITHNNCLFGSSSCVPTWESFMTQPVQEQVQLPAITFTQIAPPDFINKDERYWTRDQCAEYEQWWQQLPSCQFDYCSQGPLSGRSLQEL